jgi:hypothetical protein
LTSSVISHTSQRSNVVETSGLRHTRPTPDPRSTNFSKIHREPSLKSESVIHRATPNTLEAKCIQAEVILLRRLCGMAALE